MLDTALLIHLEEAEKKKKAKKKAEEKAKQKRLFFPKESYPLKLLKKKT